MHCLILGGWVFGSSYLMKTAEIECIRVIAMTTNFGTKIAVTGCVKTIATRQLVIEGPTDCRY